MWFWTHWNQVQITNYVWFTIFTDSKRLLALKLISWCSHNLVWDAFYLIECSQNSVWFDNVDYRWDSHLKGNLWLRKEYKLTKLHRHRITRKGFSKQRNTNISWLSQYRKLKRIFWIDELNRLFANVFFNFNFDYRRTLNGML